MNLLINEPPLQVLPTLANKIGLNEAIVLQQMHYWLRISKNERDGFIWVYKSYPDWQREFPFWSETTVKRIITSLEKQQLIISTDIYNKMPIDRTKWYRINYEKLMVRPSCQNDLTNSSNCTEEEVNLDSPTSQFDTTNNQRLLQENTTKENNLSGKPDNAKYPYETIINYLNEKAGTKYRHTSQKTQQLIRSRYNEGFSTEDFRIVIDKKVSTWLNDAKMNTYLRPETLFGTKFESYLNEKVGVNIAKNQRFTAGNGYTPDLGF